MSPAATPPPLPPQAPPRPPPPQGRVLRRLFLTLFLRGRSSRGLQKQTVPKSVGQRLAFTLFFYALFGSFALGFIHQPVFALSIYLHSMTFVLLGMFVASSAGEVLFNKEESDILQHRPVTPRALLWAKISVLAQVSLWLAGAFNLAGMAAGIAASDGGWLYPLAHAVSTALEALFCASCVVMTYQLCLRWFGRERLDAFLTTAQVLVTIVIIGGSQLMPRMMIHQKGGLLSAAPFSPWIGLLPPAWFAGFDDALAGTGATRSWILAALALVGTASVLALAVGRLARDYQTGLQTLSESSGAKPRPASRRWILALVKTPPMRWWLRDSAARAAFLLTVTALARDRETKLRIYPGLAPLLVFPVIILIQNSADARHGSAFGAAFAGAYLGLIPLMALNLLQYSQQWQAADLFRAAPVPGPIPLCQGARRAVLCVLTLPLLALFALAVWLLSPDTSQLALLLPGVVMLPVYSLIPCLKGKAVPLSLPAEDAKSASRGLTIIAVMPLAMGVAGLAAWAWSKGWFGWFLLGETALAAAVYAGMSASLRSVRWPPLD